MGKHWSNEEINILKHNRAIAKSWEEISLLLSNRTPKAVESKWYYIHRIGTIIEYN